MNKKLVQFTIVAIISSFLFSLCQINFVGDISLIAFPLSLIYVLVFAYASYILLIKHLKLEKLSLVVKLFQYLPYVLLAAFVFRRAGERGTAHFYDVLTVLLWVVIMVSAQGALYFLSHKRVFEKNPDLKKIAEHSPTPPLPFFKKVIFEILDWVDAFVQAICTVVLINIFIFQLYEIPSESMVSEFLVRDRVVGLKLDAGPKFPLSDVGIPEVKNYKRGDIVIFSNPHYSNDRESQIKTFMSQLVYMLTLTTVNLNVDEDGNLKADPLVKRIVGEEGEQLVMQDGILYSRTKDAANFTPVADDAIWAQWNLAALPNDILEKVQYIPLSSAEYEVMLDIEYQRSMLDIQGAKEESEKIAERFESIAKNASVLRGSIADDYLLNENSLQVYSFLSNSDDIIRNLYYSNGGYEWFSAFMTDWTHSVPNDVFDGEDFIGGDIYSDAMFRQNLMLKLSFGRLAVRTAELLDLGVNANAQNQDLTRLQFMQHAQNLAFYILTLNDMRNMEVFPSNDEAGNAQYISKNNFFVMGDNRFNSLDMRHSYDYERKQITTYDPWSLYYDSNLAPQQISTDNILGSPVLRFFPFNRFGIPGGN